MIRKRIISNVNRVAWSCDNGGLLLEECDMAAALGDEYRDCRDRVGMIVPKSRREAGAPVVKSTAM